MSSALSELAHHRKRKGGHMDGSISSLHLWSISLLCGLHRPPAPLCLPWDRPRIDRVAFGASLTGLRSRSDNIFCVVISQPRTQIQTSDRSRFASARVRTHTHTHTFTPRQAAVSILSLSLSLTHTHTHTHLDKRPLEVLEPNRPDARLIILVEGIESSGALHER